MMSSHLAPKKVCAVSGETPHEEHVNFLTHVTGLLLSFFGWIVLLNSSIGSGDMSYIIGCSVYGATLVAMYAASSYYHYCKNIDQKRILRIIDHACIYLLIAGSYTPFTLVPLREAGGLTMLWTMWSIAVIGIVFKVFAINRFQLLSLFAYLGMGWLVMFHIPSLMDNLSMVSMVLLMTGGFAYTLGTVFYVWDSLPYNHAIWHLFVLSGSACHYFSIFHLIP